MSSPFIVIDEITSKINEMNTSLTTKIDNLIGATGNTGGSTTAGTVMAKLNKVITDTTTILTNTNTNNTASTSGTLSQKVSSAISNTAATTTENSSGTLSAKLTYLINRRDRFYLAGSTNLKTITTNLTSSATTKNSTNTSTAYSGYTGYVYACFDGIYRVYCTGYATVVNLENHNSYGPSQLNHAFCEISVNDSVVANMKVATQGASKGSCASATKTVDIHVKKADSIRFRMYAVSERHTVDACSGDVRCANEVTATTTEISIRGTLKEVTSIFY